MNALEQAAYADAAADAATYAAAGDRVRCGEPCPACIAAVEALVAEECGS